MPSDFVRFARAWAGSPKLVGAVLPSGEALAGLITSEISPDTGPVLELGPGTGVFTRALLARGVAPSNLTLVEAHPDFARDLQRHFPGVRVLCTDARRLAQAEIAEGRPLGAVVSGLPLLNMSTRTVLGILTGAFAHLRPGGGFYQFTYGPTCPVRRAIRERLELRVDRIGRTLRNFPPASVYRFARGQPARA